MQGVIALVFLDVDRRAEELLRNAAAQRGPLGQAKLAVKIIKELVHPVMQVHNRIAPHGLGSAFAGGRHAGARRLLLAGLLLFLPEPVPGRDFLEVHSITSCFGFLVTFYP